MHQGKVPEIYQRQSHCDCRSHTSLGWYSFSPMFHSQPGGYIVVCMFSLANGCGRLYGEQPTSYAIAEPRVRPMSTGHRLWHLLQCRFWVFWPDQQWGDLQQLWPELLQSLLSQGQAENQCPWELLVHQRLLIHQYQMFQVGSTEIFGSGEDVFWDLQQTASGPDVGMIEVLFQVFKR
jgi:hypothetical protein